MDRTTAEEPAADGPRPRPREGLLGVLRETVLVVVLSLVIATAVRIFLVQAFLIPSASMEDTLRIEDRVLVSKLTTRFGEVRRGDVVVFADPGAWLGPADVSERPGGPLNGLRAALEFVGVLPDDAEGHLVKRVIGRGGDRVACCDAEGRLTVNGVPVEERYLYPGDAPSIEEFEVDVPTGRLWVMGDHRSNSGDSRVHGFVPESAVTGRAFAVLWPLSRWSMLDRPSSFDAVPEPAR